MPIVSPLPSSRVIVRTRRRAALFIVLAMVALAMPVAAFAWSQTYASYVVFKPDGIALSSFNSGLNFNHFSWSDQYGGGPNTGQTTLCDASYSCYPYSESTSGNLTDTRSISYGRAKCHSKASNFYPMLVYECYTHN